MVDTYFVCFLGCHGNECFVRTKQKLSVKIAYLESRVKTQTGFVTTAIFRLLITVILTFARSTLLF